MAVLLSMKTFLPACCTGGMVGSVDDVGYRHLGYGVKDMGNAFSRALILHTSSIVGWSCEGAIFCI